ncbi:unnamed protein product [Clavelina lepadiformis]|uniref:SH3 domain-containing protein n=1 Tax=Clavelina lepadiformis TaxID=159417 RepID=A0ABP0GAP3_CLALP
MIPTVMKVFLSEDPSSIVEVPITPNTTALDVIECCKEPGENSCHLAELWRGKERSVSENEKPYTILQQWGSHATEVRFYLRHFDSPMIDNKPKQSDWGSGNGQINPGYIAQDGRIMTPNGVDMTLKELKEIAQKQQQQIEMQQQTLVGKEQRLKFLKQQMQQQQVIMGENEKLRRLREKAEAQEAKLRKIRALRGKVEQQRYENTTMSTELEAVRSLFEEKQMELSTAMSKVQDLTTQLDELRKGRLLSSNIANGSVFSSTTDRGNENQTTELEKLQKEMAILNRMNEEQQKRLDEQRGVLKKRNEDASDLDRRIEELTNRLRQKKLFAGGTNKDTGLKNSRVPPTRMHTIVAAVEPLIQQSEPNISGPPMKNINGITNPDLIQGKYDTPAGRNIVGRIDKAPYPGFQRGQPEGVNNPYNQQPPDLKSLPPYSSDNPPNSQDNRDFYQRSMPPSSRSLDGIRPQSAMAQLFPDNGGGKQDSLTAKVRPMRNKTNSVDQPPASSGGQYYQATIKDGSKSPTKTAPSGGGINLFAYNQPPPTASTADPGGHNRTNVTVLPSGNVKYTQSPFTHPPPPYPNTVADGNMPEQGYERDMYGNALSPDRPITVDIEALRRKFAHAPRPLKKRGSFTEPERPTGPSIPKLFYDQIYKKADTPFYRPGFDQAHRSTPPPAYVEPKAPPPVISQKPKRPEQKSESEEAPSDAVSYESNITPTEFLRQQKNLRRPPVPTKQPVDKIDEDVEDKQEMNYSSPEPDVTDEKDSSSELSSSLPPPPMPSLSLVPTKGILKELNAPSKGPNRRIKFDPLALLLDASLEGEFDLVKEIIDQVSNSSGANDEGITALHNAVCAGHFDLVKFLVHYGSDINASDTDGWTPLHCAASCNNLPMARFLVENGACIFAATLSDGETAADKCEELDEGYMLCSEYLYGIQEKLGVVRQGQVYALYDYRAVNDDELSFRDGDLMTILKRGDEYEREWWGARLGEKEGYVPRNLIGMWPRIKPKEEQD